MSPEIVLKWVARGTGVVSTLLLLAFAFGGAEHLHFKPAEAVAFLFFPVGVIVGFLVAWRWELAGGLASIGSLALFYVWHYAVSGTVAGGPYFLLFTAPGFLHVASALSARRRITPAS
jgi:hypothetical protein